MSQRQPHTVQFLQLEVGDQSPLQAKERLLCDVASKHFRAGRTVLIAASPDRVLALDRLLWEWRPESFVPHGILPCPLDDLMVFLTGRPCEIEGIDVLLCAAPIAPIDWMAQFPHVVDVVEIDIPQLRDQGRGRFKQWREFGVKPTFETFAAQEAT